MPYLVHTPTVKDDNVDPFDKSFDEVCSPTQRIGDIAKREEQNPPDSVKGNASKATEKPPNPVEPFEHTQEPARTYSSPSMAVSGADSSQSYQRSNSAQAIDSNPQDFQTQSRHPRPDERYRPSALDTHTPPRRQSDDISPRQRKHVTFHLPSANSTVPSTPINITPPSSPDSVSSNSSFEYVGTKSHSATNKDAATISHRPPLHRSAQSSSTYITDKRVHEPVLPRSSSSRDLPAKNSKACNPPAVNPGTYNDSSSRNHSNSAKSRGTTASKPLAPPVQASVPPPAPTQSSSQPVSSSRKAYGPVRGMRGKEELCMKLSGEKDAMRRR